MTQTQPANRSKRQHKLSDMSGYSPDDVVIVEREEAAAVKMRVEGYETLKALNAELLAALKAMVSQADELAAIIAGTRHKIGFSNAALVSDIQRANAAIAKAEGR